MPGQSQREQLAAWETGLAASGLPVAGLDAPRPKPRFAQAAPLGAALAGEAELVDVWLVERWPVWRVREALAANLPPGHRLIDLYDVWLGEPALPGRVVASDYRAELAIAPAALDGACATILASASIMRERAKGDSLVAYDLRPFIEALDVTPDRGGAGSTLRMRLRHDPEKGVGRPDEVLAAIEDRLAVDVRPVAIVRETVVLGDPAPAPPPAPRRGSRGAKR
jgi:radical SAM-linked protein